MHCRSVTLPILLSWLMVCKSDASQCIAVLSPSQSCCHGLWFASLMLHSALLFCHPPICQHPARQLLKLRKTKREIGRLEKMNSSAEDHANLLGLRARLDCVDLTPRKMDLCKPAWKLRARLDCVDAQSSVWKKRKLGIIMHRDVTFIS